MAEAIAATDAAIRAPSAPAVVKPGPVAAAPVMSGKPPGRVPGEVVRGEGGKFAPANGKPAEAKPEAPKPAPYRFKRELMSYGQKTGVDFSEDDIERELSRGMGALRRDGDARAAITRVNRIMELAKSDPREFIREMGGDPDAFAQKHLAEQVRLETMTEEERKHHDIAQENARLKSEFEKLQKTAAETAQGERVQRARAQNVAEFTEALKLAGEPGSPQMLYLMAQVKRDAMEEGRELTPAQIAREAIHQKKTFYGAHVSTLKGAEFDKEFGPQVDAFLDSFSKPDPAKAGAFLPDGDALCARLGEKRIEAILASTVAKWEASQSFDSKPVEEVPPAARPMDDKPREYVDEGEINRRARALMSGGR